MQRLAMFFFMLAAAPLASAATPEQATGPAFVEGEHYKRLKEPRDTGSPETVEVMEFFWYGCGHCFATESHIRGWLENKPEGITFTRVPATLSRNWLLHARAFYTAHKLGVDNQMHEAMFNAIHRERNPLRTPDDIAALFESVAGVSPEKFREAFNSFAVDNELVEADALARAYPLTGVPSFVVDGKYLTTAGMAGSYSALLEVVAMLSERELADAGASADAPAAE